MDMKSLMAILAGGGFEAFNPNGGVNPAAALGGGIVPGAFAGSKSGASSSLLPMMAGGVGAATMGSGNPFSNTAAPPAYASRAGIEDPYAENPADIIGNDETRKKMIRSYLDMTKSITPSVSGAATSVPPVAPQASLIGNQPRPLSPIPMPANTPNLRLQYLMQQLKGASGQNGLLS